MSGAITWAMVSSIMTVPDRDDTFGPMMISRLCTDVSAFGYYCEPHRLNLANVGNLAMHLESEGRHHIAAYCPKHRRYEAPDDAQMRALTGVAV